MGIPDFPFEQLDAAFYSGVKTEYQMDLEWLFDKLLVMLNAQRNVRLLADQLPAAQEDGNQIKSLPELGGIKNSTKRDCTRYSHIPFQTRFA